MGWLKKVGQVALEVGKMVAGVSPIVKLHTPDNVDRVIDRVADVTQEIVQIIVQAEIMGQALGVPGPDKLKAAAPAVAQVILRSDALIGKKIADDELFQRGTTKIADGFADVLNSLADEDVEAPRP